jgi:hypothetical protein
MKLAVFAAVAAALLVGGGTAFAGSVKGFVVDEAGAPMPGVTVEVVYQTYRADELNSAGASIKASAVTGDDGRYAIVTDHLPPGEYAANAFEVVVNGGQEMVISLIADDETTFAGNADTVRNFTGGIVENTPDMPYGNAGVFVLNNAIGDFTDLSAAVVTLTNIETGKVLVKPVRHTGEGLAITGIPFGTYEASVSLDGAPLQVKLWSPDAPPEFGPTVTHDFTMGWAGNQMQVAATP